MSKRGNPWLNVRCTECGTQLMSGRNLGLASFFRKDDEDPWKTGLSDSVLRFVCLRCSCEQGFED